jgi:anaerobic C4-dicarboxylate transporter
LSRERDNHERMRESEFINQFGRLANWNWKSIIAHAGYLPRIYRSTMCVCVCVEMKQAEKKSQPKWSWDKRPVLIFLSDVFVVVVYFRLDQKERNRKIRMECRVVERVSVHLLLSLCIIIMFLRRDLTD